MLSDADTGRLETLVRENPADTCARGYLIAYGRLSTREHLLWIENNPEWDGFLAWPSFIRVESDKSNELIKDAWERQIAPHQQSGAVLHNAAMFFANTDPYVSETLLQRAMRLEPAEGFHAEGLGYLYLLVIALHRDAAFAAHAREALLGSDNWVVVAGAVNSLFAYMVVREISEPLVDHLHELTGRPGADVLKDLPSHAACYHLPHCMQLSLETRCK